MENIIPLFNTLFALGGIGIAFASAILLFDLYSKNKSLEGLVSLYGLAAAFLITLASSITTLVYSEIFGFIPCGLCWLQRVFLYPQVLLLAFALYTKDKRVALYGIVLSVPGLIVSLYQHYLQMGGSEFITCPKAGAGANCAERIMFEFGFVTFPLLSAILFTFLIVLYFYIHKGEN
jgi:disulfide bond formation protein DsbB